MLRSSTINIGLRYEIIEKIAFDLDAVKEFMEKDQIKDIKLIE